jgi:hypothetical protein
MEANYHSIILRDVSLIDLDDLRNSLPHGNFSQSTGGASSDSHDELATIFILTITPLVITAFTAWLLRTHTEEQIQYQIITRNPNGTETTLSLNIDRSSSKAPEAQIVSQIAKALKVPESAIINVKTN